MDNIIDVIKTALAVCKDKASDDIIQRFCGEYNALSQAEAQCRRDKASALIKNMARLKNTLKNFEFTYARIRPLCGNIPAVDDYIKKINAEIKRMSFEKNNL